VLFHTCFNNLVLLFQLLWLAFKTRG